MSVGFNFFLHVIFVLLCIGLGYVLRWSMEEFKELDRHIESLNRPEQVPSTLPTALPSTASALQAKADPAKLAELKASIKK